MNPNNLCSTKKKVIKHRLVAKNNYICIADASRITCTNTLMDRKKKKFVTENAKTVKGCRRPVGGVVDRVECECDLGYVGVVLARGAIRERRCFGTGLDVSGMSA